SNREWTPRNTVKEKKAEVVIFSDTSSAMAIDVLKNIDEVVRQYGNEAEFLFRPVFFESDRFQKMVIHSLFCFYNQDKKLFWNILKMTLGKHQEKTEAVIFSSAKSFNIDMSVFKNCLLQQKSESLVKYHLDYAKYLGIHSGPVIYVNGL